MDITSIYSKMSQIRESDFISFVDMCEHDLVRNNASSISKATLQRAITMATRKLANAKNWTGEEREQGLSDFQELIDILNNAIKNKK